MKRFILSVLSMLAVTVCMSQWSEEVINANGINLIRITADFGDIELKTHSGKDIIVKTEAVIDDGKQNDLLVLNNSRSGNQIILDSYVKDYDKLPKRKTVYNQHGDVVEISDVYSKDGFWKSEWKDNKGRVEIEDKVEIKHIVEVPSRLSVEINIVYGNLVYQGSLQAKSKLMSTYGSVDIALDQFIAPLFVESGYNFVDVSIDPEEAFNLKMSSTYGSYYTDLELNFEPRPKSENIVASLNGGGVALNLKSQYNNIYLRSAK